MSSCILSLFLSILCLIPCSGKVVVKEYNDLQNMKPGKAYVIKGNVDLRGNMVTIPAGCEMVFKGGSIENGELCFNDTKISGRNVSFSGINVSGKIKNEELYAKWFTDKGATSDDYLVDAIKLACESNASFVFDDREYNFYKPIFVYGKCNLIGTGKTIIRSFENGQHIFVLAGNTAVGGKAIVWEGKIKGINFIAQTGNYNYYLGLLNVRNCEVSDCSFDMSNKGVNCSNKVIASVNNANYSNPSKGENISILRNVIRFQAENEDRNNGECIGVESRTNVLIEGNVIYNTRDDLGIHNCQSVVVKNNTIYAYDGRIYVSNSKDIEITNNSISYVFPTATGMGVFVGVESGYDQVPERIKIEKNTIDYSRASQTPCYGIRVRGANYVDVLHNVITGNPTVRIAIEIVEAKESQQKGLKNKGMLVPQHIRIEGNDTNGLWFAGYAKYKIEGLRVLNNTIRKELVITHPEIEFRGNTVDESMQSRPAPTKSLNRYKKL